MQLLPMLVCAKSMLPASLLGALSPILFMKLQKFGAKSVTADRLIGSH